jgi:hypothetical protein
MLWALFTPIIAIPSGVASLFGLIGGGEDTSKKSSDAQNQEQLIRLDKNKKS